MVEERDPEGLLAACLLEQLPPLEHGLAHSSYLAGLCLLRIGDRTKAHDYFTAGYEQAFADLGPASELTRNMKKRRDGLAAFARSQLKEVVAPDNGSARANSRPKPEVLMKVRPDATPSIMRPAVRLFKPLKTEAGSLQSSQKRRASCCSPKPSAESSRRRSRSSPPASVPQTQTSPSV